MKAVKCSVLFILALAVVCASGARTSAEKPKDAKLVEYFLKTPVAELPPDAVDYFLKINPETLPRKLRDPYLAKRTQLQSLKRLYDLNAYGPRKADKASDCAAIKDGGEAMAGIIGSEGFSEITGAEEQWLIQKTHCQEVGLMCEFTLTIVRQKKTKTKKFRIWRFLNDKDPLFVLLGMKRQGSPDPDESGSFGESNYPRCR